MENISERDRIKEEEEIQDIYDKFCIWYHDDGSYDNFHKSEAIKSINDYSNEKIENLLEWLTSKDSPYSILYGDQKRFCTNDKDLTIKELISEYQQFKTKRDEK